MDWFESNLAHGDITIVSAGRASCRSKGQVWGLVDEVLSHFSVPLEVIKVRNERDGLLVAATIIWIQGVPWVIGWWGALNDLAAWAASHLEPLAGPILHQALLRPDQKLLWWLDLLLLQNWMDIFRGHMETLGWKALVHNRKGLWRKALLNRDRDRLWYHTFLVSNHNRLQRVYQLGLIDYRATARFLWLLPLGDTLYFWHATSLQSLSCIRVDQITRIMIPYPLIYDVLQLIDRLVVSSIDFRF